MSQINREKISVAFGRMTNPVWVAGNHYLQNLLGILRSASKLPFEYVVLFTELSDDDRRIWENYADRLLLFNPLPPAWLNKLPPFIAKKAAHRINHYAGKMEQLGVDIAFTLLGYEKPLTVPSLCWIPDFQHLHYPEFFPTDELAERNASYLRWISEATRVIVSSNAVLDDLRKFAPEYANKGRVLRFVMMLPDSIYQQKPTDIADLYHLPDRFFILPNQFWMHKNHRVILHGLSLAKVVCPDICIVCTGSTRDHRNPFYFNEILADISQLDVHSNVQILGQIPREHVYQLMRRSLALVQPSLFEGWSSSVEEAKSLGKHVILSDISTHREQTPRFADYFAPNAADQLAKILVKLHQVLQPGPDLDQEQSARLDLQSREYEMVATFDKIVLDALER